MKPLLVGQSGDSVFGEGYRVLRTALSYCWSEGGSRVILVTSTAPGEGKTLTSVNLAETFASQGRVLLIDGDMRKPQVHAMLKGRRSPGLSDVLVGRAKVSEAIQNPPGAHASFLPAGTSVPSPADISTNAMRELINGLRKVYDWVIIDTPPVAAVADALAIASLADGVVLVVGAEMVPRRGVRHTLDRINETGAVCWALF